jgi:hypothetical protein
VTAACVHMLFRTAHGGYIPGLSSTGQMPRGEMGVGRTTTASDSAIERWLVRLPLAAVCVQCGSLGGFRVSMSHAISASEIDSPSVTVSAVNRR